MSLLLDALKKAGQGRQNDAAGQHPPTDGTSAQPAAATASSRAAGKKLFSAKLPPVRGRIQLGIVPMALIGGSIFAAIYGTYLWYELRPVPAAVRPAVHRPPPPTANLAPAAPLAPLTPPPPSAAPVQEAQTTAPPEPAAAPRVARQPTAAPASITATKPVQSYARPEAPPIRIKSRPQTNRIDPVLSSAYQSYRAGDLATAHRQYVAALKQDSSNRDALLGMAAVAQQQGQDAIAAQYYRHMLTLDPRDPVAQAGLAALSNDHSPTEESRLKMLLGQQPQSAALNFALGNLYAGKQRWPEAQQAYFNAYNLQPDSADYALNLAVSLDHMGQGKAAAQYYQRALQLSSDSPNAGFDRKQVQQRLDALKAP
jgi:Tfp pilus assembly protein PilF